jgi:hypothetical protein
VSAPVYPGLAQPVSRARRNPLSGHSSGRSRHADLGITTIRLRILPAHGWLLSLAGVPPRVLPPSTVLIGVRALILVQ